MFVSLRNYFFPQVTPVKEAPTFDLAKRKEELKLLAEDMYKQMSNKDIQVEVVIDPKHFGACTDDGKLYIHPFCLFKLEDFPPHLLLSGLYDPLVRSQEWTRDVIFWMAEKAGVEKKKLMSKTSQTLLPFIALMKADPSLWERFKKFTLAHEMAHIYHKHHTSAWDILLAPVIAAVITVAYCGWVLSIQIIALYLLTWRVTFFALNLLKKHISRGHEIEADLTAIKICKETNGAYMFFSMVDIVKQEIIESIPLHKKILKVLTSPEFFFFNHPSGKTRTEIIEKANSSSCKLIAV